MTRQRYHIGTLTYKNNIYLFQYENNAYRRKLDEAMDNGYQPHLAFPDVNRVYKSKTLFGPFARRLPDSRRPDYHILLRELGLFQSSSEMDILKATGGILATDSYEFVTPIVVDNNHFEINLFVAGWRYYEGEEVIKNLQIGDEINFKLELSNTEDDKAIIVLSSNREKLGYIPAFYSSWMYEIITKNCNYKSIIEGIHPNALPHRKLNISIVGEVSNSINTEKILNDDNKLNLVYTINQ